LRIKKSFLYCKKADQDPVFDEQNARNDYDVILKLLVHILEFSNYLALQRERLFIRKYYLEDNELEIWQLADNFAYRYTLRPLRHIVCLMSAWFILR